MTPKRYYYEGGWRTLTEIGRMTGISRATLDKRLSRGMALKQAIDEPTRAARTYTFKGETLTVSEWSVRTGLNRNCLRERLGQFRIPVELALTCACDTPTRKRTRLRNLKVIRRMTLAFRDGFPAASSCHRGRSATLPLPSGTGPGRNAHDLQSETSGVSA